MFLDSLLEINPVLLTFLATCFTWLGTAIGAALVFGFKKINRKVLDGMLGFAAGVMLAASFWSLLSPSIEMAKNQGKISWLPAAIGFLTGGFFLRLVDWTLPHLHFDTPTEQAEGIKTGWRRSILLVLAITLHNIPEGLAVGVAFGAMASGLPSVSLSGAFALAIGMAIQNFPEGASVSIPLRSEGMSRFKSFWYGQLSGLVEPISGVLGAIAVYYIQPVLPFALAFAAGAMIFVVVEELIPESQRSGNTHIATMSTMIGFTVMMILDIGLS